MLHRRILGASLGVFLAASCAAAGDVHRGEACDRPPEYMKFHGEPLSVAEAEAKSLEEMKKTPKAPQVPFGYQNAKWEALKSKMRPGDKLFQYSAGGHGGHVLVRNGCIVFLLTEWMV